MSKFFTYEEFVLNENTKHERDKLRVAFSKLFTPEFKTEFDKRLNKDVTSQTSHSHSVQRFLKVNNVSSEDLYRPVRKVFDSLGNWRHPNVSSDRNDRYFTDSPTISVTYQGHYTCKFSLGGKKYGGGRQQVKFELQTHRAIEDDDNRRLNICISEVTIEVKDFLRIDSSIDTEKLVSLLQKGLEVAKKSVELSDLGVRYMIRYMLKRSPENKRMKDLDSFGEDFPDKHRSTLSAKMYGTEISFNRYKRSDWDSKNECKVSMHVDDNPKTLSVINGELEKIEVRLRGEKFAMDLGIV